MNSRYMPAFATALLLVGLSAGVVGLLRDYDDLFGTGLFLVLTAVPLLIIRTIHNTQRATAAQLADADNAGYVRALDHVARGLLDAPAPPNPGHRNGEQAAGNVITLRPHQHQQPERKAL
ncbi:hypothetical protein [Streptomyces sp. NPDC003717]|uniref:hypothetical protein n=1 Tax=Streptomyces sp. NPDC003717 TaxID=3154276 RepID=UPI0033A3AEEF